MQTHSGLHTAGLTSPEGHFTMPKGAHGRDSKWKAQPGKETRATANLCTLSGWAQLPMVAFPRSSLPLAPPALLCMQAPQEGPQLTSIPILPSQSLLRQALTGTPILHTLEPRLTRNQYVMSKTSSQLWKSLHFLSHPLYMGHSVTQLASSLTLRCLQARHKAPSCPWPLFRPSWLRHPALILLWLT